MAKEGIGGHSPLAAQAGGHPMERNRREAEPESTAALSERAFRRSVFIALAGTPLSRPRAGAAKRVPSSHAARHCLQGRGSRSRGRGDALCAGQAVADPHAGTRLMEELHSLWFARLKPPIPFLFYIRATKSTNAS